MSLMLFVLLAAGLTLTHAFGDFAIDQIDKQRIFLLQDAEIVDDFRRAVHWLPSHQQGMLVRRPFESMPMTGEELFWPKGTIPYLIEIPRKKFDQEVERLAEVSGYHIIRTFPAENVVFLSLQDPSLTQHVPHEKQALIPVPIRWRDIGSTKEKTHSSIGIDRNDVEMDTVGSGIGNHEYVERSRDESDQTDQTRDSSSDISSRYLSLRPLDSDVALPIKNLIVNSVDLSRYEMTVKSLSGEAYLQLKAGLYLVRSRSTYSSQHVTAALGILNMFESVGLTGMLDEFTLPSYFQSTPTQNVVAWIPGSVYPHEVIVVGAHYDTTSKANPSGGDTESAPGAEDNASGVAALVEMASAIMSSQYRPDRTIHFVAFGGEEQGLYGSTHYISRFLNAPQDFNLPDNSEIVTALTLDMIAFSVENFGLVIEGMPFCADLVTDVSSHVAYVNQNASPGPQPLAFEESLTSFGSDHVTFQRSDIPAILAIDLDWARYGYESSPPGFSYGPYHTSLDTPRNLNYTLGVANTRVLLAALVDYAGIDNEASVTNGPLQEAPCSVCALTHATCSGTNDTCECLPGYTPSGSATSEGCSASCTCADVDECDAGTHTCHPSMLCRNDLGGYTCFCQTGFVLTSEGCQDIDECVVEMCTPPSECVNLAGGYACQTIQQEDVNEDENAVQFTFALEFLSADWLTLQNAQNSEQLLDTLEAEMVNQLADAAEVSPSDVTVLSVTPGDVLVTLQVLFTFDTTDQAENAVQAALHFQDLLLTDPYSIFPDPWFQNVLGLYRTVSVDIKYTSTPLSPHLTDPQNTSDQEDVYTLASSPASSLYAAALSPHYYLWLSAILSISMSMAYLYV
eukprot:TRINITY_DN844_c0_g1::TRINITY_DN844_c0_g1_i1::g.25398::m.25398 TRINITY_DN844_c0_g1::TRINITY_DN844_c0_g1_i1::g.25398  ORF type:complete len:851 (+),score=134.28,sp/E5R501/M28P3_LEPMJ/35.40/5e-13,Peptidase_M28/PF04389.12/7.4e-34,EGF_CA/PF07645.10/7.9e+03,EGF_CA/PF07645.10/2.9e-09,EGF_CA/PF07645.10/0.0016,cEGF/PF12662.2/0.014,cEGF/PF12662.2/1e-05,Peptidase_M20/PF01546.23/1.9e-07,EGF_3/PF12947.2/1.5e+04,EGF_3/PF12947.2/0.00022,EGF_3/PF12947.2/4.8e+02,Nicastrin/PF05450.10/0.054,Nicastrin/PF05450.10/1.